MRNGAEEVQGVGVARSDGKSILIKYGGLV